MKIAIILTFFTLNVFALSPGDKAPSFKLVNEENKQVELKQFLGKIVVLEWYNHGCPFVKKHYLSKNMQNTQKTFMKNKNVVWLSIVSSVKGKQGHLADYKIAKEQKTNSGSFANHLLLDFDGKVGRQYEAKTTPHIYVIDAKGVLQYEGAIDSIASTDPKDIKEAKNYALSAVSKLLLQEKPNPQKTKPYGCSVKY